jgi:hypothetical protein
MFGYDKVFLNLYFQDGVDDVLYQVRRLLSLLPQSTFHRAMSGASSTPLFDTFFDLMFAKLTSSVY